MSSVRIINIVSEDSQSGPSGVKSFLTSFDHLGSQPGIQYEKILLPAATGARMLAKANRTTDGADRTDTDKPSRLRELINGARLLLGYVRLLMADIRRLRKVASTVGGDPTTILVVQEFGCETLPIAVRIVFPKNRRVAIAHTHPGMNEEARHPVRRWVEALCYRSISTIVFNSASSKEQWARKLGRSDLKGTIIRHGMPAPAVIHPIDYPAKPPGTVDFVCVARFCHWKGQRELLQAWRKVVDKSTQPVRLILVGDGPTFEAIKSLAQELKVTGSVIFLGTRPDGAAYFEPGDVCVLLSNEPEAFGLVFLEAMSRTKPVIASRLGGIPEVVESEVTGLLVDPTDADEVVRAIQRMADSQELRRRMGEAGAERWRTHFAIERMLGNYADFFLNQKIDSGSYPKLSILQFRRGMKGFAK
jgi:glycosyltransferase involved in cell wall biosynthesis